MSQSVACPACGRPNAADARFCSNCGTSLVTRVGVEERRVVTALFADLARSTGLGATLDPEVMRGIVGRFFEIAAAQVERRGGTVEKFSGDAVMAVFGIPSAHEDDPERAVRAALAIHEAIGALSEDIELRHGIAIQARVGIEEGEVVVGDPFGGATMATGDAMNMAARLEQQAEPGDIVVGATAWSAVRDMVSAEPLGEVAIRGRDTPLPAWRVLAISDEVGRPRGVPGLQAPLTGRDEEMALLLGAARRAQHERKAVLFTLVGVPGVGKSRLVRETSERLASDGWRSIRGRCLPYGQGITYWPVAEMVRTLADVSAATPAGEVESRLAAISPEADVAAKLRLAIGLAADDGSADGRGAEGLDREIAWAFRRLIEHAAADSPLVLVFEDIHWAEPQLLDLIEYLATWARDAPLLIVCPTRPELLDGRPSWGAGRMEANRLQLEPLTEEESRTLLGALLEVDDIPASLRARILERAEGNPLFVEETVRMLIEEGVVERRGSRWVARPEAADMRVPDSIEALIRARLDTLPAPERAVLQAASVVGRVFQRSAVAAVAGAVVGGSAASQGSDLDRHLEDAVLRDLITEERAPSEATFRFRHILIRDVAYATLPKARRIDLHRAAAAWLRDWAGNRHDEFVEIEAYHLEQAALLGRELHGRLEPADRDAALAALHRSADRASAREDARAMQSFTERALALEPPPGEQRAELKALLIEALAGQGQYTRSGALAHELEDEAGALGRMDLVGRALFVKSGQLWLSVEASDPQGALAELNRARELLTAAGDDFYLAGVLNFIGHEGWWYGDLDRAERVWLEMREVARRSGLLGREAEAVMLLSKLYGSRGEFERRRQALEEARDLAARGNSRLQQVLVERMWGSFLALSESEAEARQVLAAVAGPLEELGAAEETYVALAFLGEIELRAGQPAEALAYFERGLEMVRDHVGYLPEALRRVAAAQLELGDLEAAEKAAQEAVRVTGQDDVATVASTASTLGTVREAQRRFEEAEELLRRAVEIIAGTDYSGWDPELALAEFLLRRGRLDEGQEWLAQARASAAKYGPNSPLLGYVEQRAAEAEAAGTAADSAE